MRSVLWSCLLLLAFWQLPLQSRGQVRQPDTISRRKDSLIQARGKIDSLRDSVAHLKTKLVHTDSAAQTYESHHAVFVPKKRVDYYAGKNILVGVHTGINIARAINSSGDIISKPTSGLMAGLYYQHGLRLFGGRTELNYSRQGFQYNSNGSQGHIKNDYLSLVTMSTFTVAHRAQFQFGTQEGFLVNSQDSQGNSAGKATPLNAFNRFDFGLTAGVEAYPYLGTVIGFRYNLGLTNLVRRPDNSLATYIPFYQIANSYNVRNGVFQIYVAYQLTL